MKPSCLLLNFAGDQVLIAQDELYVEFILERQHKNYNNWGLEINFTKRRCVSTGSK
jgi:hypothetical protein